MVVRGGHRSWRGNDDDNDDDDDNGIYDDDDHDEFDNDDDHDNNYRSTIRLKCLQNYERIRTSHKKAVMFLQPVSPALLNQSRDIAAATKLSC